MKWCGLGQATVKSCFPAYILWPTLSALGCKPRSRRSGQLKVPHHCRTVPRLADSMQPLVCVCLFCSFLLLFQPLPLPSALHLSHSIHSLADCLWFPTPLPPCPPSHSLFSVQMHHILQEHQAKAPSSLRQSKAPIASSGESRWNRFSNVIPHVEATVLPEKLVDP